MNYWWYFLSIPYNLNTFSDLFHYLHVGKLLHGREAREVEPGHVLPVFVVISLILQVPEGGTTQSVKLQSILLIVWTCHNIYIYRRRTQTNICMNMSTWEFLTLAKQPGSIMKNRCYLHRHPQNTYNRANWIFYTFTQFTNYCAFLWDECTFKIQHLTLLASTTLWNILYVSIKMNLYHAIDFKQITQAKWEMAMWTYADIQYVHNAYDCFSYPTLYPHPSGCQLK